MINLEDLIRSDGKDGSLSFSNDDSSASLRWSFRNPECIESVSLEVNALNVGIESLQNTFLTLNNPFGILFAAKNHSEHISAEVTQGTFFHTYDERSSPKSRHILKLLEFRPLVPMLGYHFSREISIEGLHKAYIHSLNHDLEPSLTVYGDGFSLSLKTRNNMHNISHARFVPTVYAKTHTVDNVDCMALQTTLYAFFGEETVQSHLRQNYKK